MASKNSHDLSDQGKATSPGLGMKLTIAGISRKFSTVKNIQTEQLFQQMMQTDQTDSDGNSIEAKNILILLDTRPEEEFRIGHIPGSVRVDYESKPEDIVHCVPQLEQAGVTDTVVCYCSVGYRSSVVAQKLETYFKTKGSDSEGTSPMIYNLEGSIFKWANEGRPMIDINQQKTSCTHPYNVVFGKLLNKELRKTSL